MSHLWDRRLRRRLHSHAAPKAGALEDTCVQQKPTGDHRGRGRKRTAGDRCAHLIRDLSRSPRWASSWAFLYQCARGVARSPIALPFDMAGQQRQLEDDHIGSERKRSTEWSEAPGSNPTEMPSYVLVPRFSREVGCGFMTTLI